MYLVIYAETSEKRHIIHQNETEKQARDYVNQLADAYYNKGKTYLIAKIVATNEPKREWA